MAFDTLLLERDGAVAILTINRPQVLNALNSQTLDELRPPRHPRSQAGRERPRGHPHRRR